MPETDRAPRFCGHAIQGDELFVVPDAAADERFHDNPLVTGEPWVRFYAGQPLHGAEGHRIGTFCVIDRKPRALSGAQRLVIATSRRSSSARCSSPMSRRCSGR